VSNGLAELRLTRPALANRFDALAHEEFIAAISMVARDVSSIRSLIISAEGKIFSAGGDFDEILQAHSLAETRNRMSRDAKRLFEGLVNLPIPVIAAVQGAAFGLGATVATLADIVVAWRGAKFGDAHVNVGIVAGDGGILSWSQSIGINRAKRYLLTGDAITGEQAYAFGLVTDLAENPEEVLPLARTLAARINALPAAGVNGTKRAFMEMTQHRAAEVFEMALALEMGSLQSPDIPATLERLRKR
jgi:enoyl-CoA hydratase